MRFFDRFITLPLGTYTFCIEWDEGDIDDDGKIDCFPFIDGDPVTLDWNDSEDLDMAKEIDISPSHHNNHDQAHIAQIVKAEYASGRKSIAAYALRSTFAVLCKVEPISNRPWWISIFQYAFQVYIRRYSDKFRELRVTEL